MVSDKFLDKLRDKERKPYTMKQYAKELIRYFDALDKSSRDAFRRTAITMYNNYENKWQGDVDAQGNWNDMRDKAGATTYLSVPLLASRTDTQTTFYTKTRPQYKGKAYIQTNRTKRLIKMCEELGNAELNRLLTNHILQREAQYLALATVSYRQLTLETQATSPVVIETAKQDVDVPYVTATCNSCGASSQHKQEETANIQSPTCQKCMQGTLDFSEPTAVTEQREVKKAVKIPRPVLAIPNPTQMQFDFDAPSGKESTFFVKRKKIRKQAAEFIYQIDLTSADTKQSTETQVNSRLVRQPLVDSNSDMTLSVHESAARLDEWVDDVDIWLEPSEYGLIFCSDYGQFLYEKYPEGLYLKIIGGELVIELPCIKAKEVIRLQQGTRPNSNTGTGLVNLAAMNDTINNCLSLDYAVMRTHGFPLRLLRGQYIKKIAPALQTIIVNNLPETSNLKDIVHTEQPSNTSGMAGVLSRQMGDYMQEVSGTYNFGGQVSPATRAAMGSATGAVSVQENMSDRMGLIVQMRIDADIETLWAILHLLRKDERNKQLFAEKYSEEVIEEFFAEDLESIFYFEPVKGSDEPQLESVNTFKITTFMQSTAALTGLAQYNAPLYYDLVAKLGESLNIPLDVGEGRKEKNLAESKIIRLTELYKDKAQDALVSQMNPVQFAATLYQAIQSTEEDTVGAMIEMTVESAVAPLVAQAQELAKMPEATMEMQQQLLQAIQMKQVETAERIEANLFNYEALADSYSDWMQSDAGQDSPVPVQIAVGMLYAYSLEMKALKAKVEMRDKVEMMGELMPQNTDEPPAVKRDGSTGAGRPRDPHISTGSEG